METLQKILSGNKNKTKPSRSGLNNTMFNQQPTPGQYSNQQYYGWENNQQPLSFQAQNQNPLQPQNYQNQYETQQQEQWNPVNQPEGNDNEVDEKEKKPEPVEKDYPEFLLFRINALSKHVEENFNEVNEKLNELESKINSVKDGDVEELRNSLMKLYEVIDKMNTALAEYIVKKVGELTSPISMDVSALKSTINELSLTVQGLGIKVSTLTQVLEEQSSRINELEYTVNQLIEENRFLKRKIKSLENIKLLGVDYVEPELEFSYFIDSYYDPTPQVIVVEKDGEEKEDTSNTGEVEDFNIDDLVNVPDNVTEKLLDNYYSSLGGAIPDSQDTGETPSEKIVQMKIVQDENQLFTSEVTVDAEDFNKTQLEEIVNEIKELKDKNITVLTL